MSSCTARRTWYIICEKCDLVSVVGLRYCRLHAYRIGDKCDFYGCHRGRRPNANSCYCTKHDKAYWAYRDKGNPWLYWLVLDDEGKI